MRASSQRNSEVELLVSDFHISRFLECLISRFPDSLISRFPEVACGSLYKGSLTKSVVGVFTNESLSKSASGNFYIGFLEYISLRESLQWNPEVNLPAGAFANGSLSKLACGRLYNGFLKWICSWELLQRNP